ncbi:pyridoxal phosphate-dependent decarboxylase family protein [Desulfosediminicola flagellatus]|uniref:pyridoxal phosphate-dependent decarboxylase family protein n=1 Tax=Desulfosediminicola flagellatus TaxID=2569541 RepID=UPI0010AB6343|nr:pyridoxal-dependent decarboxylase [Desulfosediminicola flagellatus]
MNENEILRRGFSVLEQYHSSQKDGRFVDYTSPGDLQRILQLDDPESEGDWEKLFTWMEQYLKYGVKSAHPSFVNRMWAGANLPSMLGEMAVAISNTSSCTFESAPVSTLMEKYMIRQMLDLVGFRNGEGQMTTGSSNANMIAMMCARNLAGKEVKRTGLFGQQELYAFVNADAHYSMDKAANILGIGIDHLIKLPVNGRGEVDPADLESELASVVEAGGIPFFVVATAGTTVRGAYDPIEAMLKLREKYKFWLHVDGAWGGAAVMSEKLRAKFLPGLSKADSFTWDFHKMLGSSLMCNILLVNHSTHTFGTVLGGGDGSYLFRDTDDNDVQDLGSVSLQCGRRVDSLKWFLDWKYFGKKGFGERIEHYLDLCRYAQECVENIPELEMVAPRVSFNICFRYKVAEHMADDFNQELRTRLYKRGLALVGLAYVKEKLILRLLITNINVNRDEIDTFFKELVAIGNELVGEGQLG